VKVSLLSIKAPSHFTDLHGFSSWLPNCKGLVGYALQVSHRNCSFFLSKIAPNLAPYASDCLPCVSSCLLVLLGVFAATR
jgi:hypothetical protein